MGNYEKPAILDYVRFAADSLKCTCSIDRKHIQNVGS
jgi:hypothetical protein